MIPPAPVVLTRVFSGTVVAILWLGLAATPIPAFGGALRLSPDLKIPALHSDIWVNDGAFMDDGSALVAGSFDLADRVAVGPLLRLSPNGVPDAEFRTELDSHRDLVDRVFPLRDGRVILAGRFGQAWGFRRLLADGRRDGTFQPEVQANGGTVCVEAPDGSLLVAGRLDPPLPMVRLDTAGKALPFRFTAPRADDFYLERLVVRASGRILVSGLSRDRRGSAYRAVFLQLNEDGSIDRHLVPDGSDGRILDFLETPEGRILYYAETPAGITRTGTLGRLGADGETDASFHPLSLTNSYVDRIAVLANSGIAVLGNITREPDRPDRYRPGILLHRDGTALAYEISVPYLEPLAIGPSGRMLVRLWDRSIAVGILHPDGLWASTADRVVVRGLGAVTFSSGVNALFVVGFLDDATPYTTIQKVGPAGQPDPTWLTSDGGRLVEATALAADGSGAVYAAGYLQGVPTHCTQDLVRFYPDGQLDKRFGVVPLCARTSRAVSCIQPLGNGQVLVGGYFHSVNGSSQWEGLVRLLPGGDADPEFNCGDLLSAHFDGVEALCVQRDGKILVGGVVNPRAGYAPVALLRVHPDGRPDTNFAGPLAGYYSSVRGIAQRGDGKLLVCGSFGSLGELERPGLALLNPDGSLDSSFDPQFSDSRGGAVDVSAMILRDDSSIVVAGHFDHVGFDRTGGLAGLTPQGTLDPSILPGIELQGDGTALAAGPDGSLYLTGRFARVGGTERLGLARFIPGTVLRAIARDSAETFRFRLEARKGQPIAIERSADLRRWETLAALTNEVDALEIIHAAPSSPAQFYRARETP